MSKKKAVRVVPLGGLKEIGKNMMVVEYGDNVIVIDAGLMFPKEHMLGVDYVIPDITYLEGKKVLGLIVTHGHEDHTGAIPHFIEDLDCPIYARKLTVAFLKAKFSQKEIPKRLHDFNEVEPRQKIKLGVFEIEFIHVSHSIVDSMALAITTPEGVIVHTGDFKIDMMPIDGPPIDLYKFAEYGEKGVELLLSDSTNVGREGYTVSETKIRKELDNLFKHNKGMIVAVTFASSIHRIQELISAAHANGKKVAFSGRSLLKYTDIARELGYLDFLTNTVIPIDEISKHKREKVVCVTTGSQGEPYSSLSLIAHKRHQHIQLRDGDIVVLSSRIIPGNESPMNSIINRIYDMGAVVIDEDEHTIHSSGHASAEELRLMYRLVKPKYFVPVHGEIKHLQKHYRLIAEMNESEEGLFVLYNGDAIELKNGEAEYRPQYTSNRYIYVDGKGVGDVGEHVLRDRRQLADNGIVFAPITLYASEDGKIDVKTEIISRGFIFDESEYGKIMGDGKSQVKQMILELPSRKRVKSSLIKYETKMLLKRLFQRELEREPLIVVTVNGE